MRKSTYLQMLIPFAMLWVCNSLAESAPVAAPEFQKAAAAIERSLNMQDAKVFDSHFDMHGLIDRAVAPLRGKPRSEEFIKGVREGATKQSFGTLYVTKLGEGGRVRLKGFVAPNIAMFRMNLADGGVDWIQMRFAKTGGRVVIEDVLPATTGEWGVELYKRLLGNAYAALNAKKGKGKEKSAIEVYTNMVDVFKQGKYQEAMRLYLQLPMDMQNWKSTLLMRMQFAQSEDDYMRAASRFRKAHPKDTAVDLLLVDFYFTKKDYKAALECISNLKTRIGKDAYLEYLEGNLLYAMKSHKGAIKALKRAIRLEHDMPDPYWTLIELALVLKNNDKVVHYMTKVMENCNVTFDPALIEKTPEYADFIKSPQYKAFKVKLQ